MMTDAAKQSVEVPGNIIDHSDDELIEIATPLWSDLVRYSNRGEYGNFIGRFSKDLLRGLNEMEVGKQFARSELTRNLDEECDFLGFIRRGQHVTCLYRVRSTKKQGEWLGRMVIGYEQEQVRIFAASVF